MFIIRTSLVKRTAADIPNHSFRMHGGKLVELQGEVDRPTVTLGWLNTLVPVADKTVAEVSEDVGHTHHQPAGPAGHGGALHPTAPDTHPSSVLGLFGGTVRAVQRVSAHSKVFPAMHSMVSDPTGIYLEILMRSRKISGKCPNVWKLNNTGVQKRSKGKLHSILNGKKIKAQNVKTWRTRLNST